MQQEDRGKRMGDRSRPLAPARSHGKHREQDQSQADTGADAEAKRHHEDCQDRRCSQLEIVQIEIHHLLKHDQADYNQRGCDRRPGNHQDYRSQEEGEHKTDRCR